MLFAALTKMPSQHAEITEVLSRELKGKCEDYDNFQESFRKQYFEGTPVFPL